MMLRSQKADFYMNIRIDVQNEDNLYNHTYQSLQQIQKTKTSDLNSTQDKTLRQSM
jgi:hypothetical protein